MLQQRGSTLIESQHHLGNLTTYSVNYLLCKVRATYEALFADNTFPAPNSFPTLMFAAVPIPRGIYTTINQISVLSPVSQISVLSPVSQISVLPQYPRSQCYPQYPRSQCYPQYPRSQCYPQYPRSQCCTMEILTILIKGVVMLLTYPSVLISGCWNRGVPLYTEVSSFQGVGIEGVYSLYQLLTINDRIPTCNSIVLMDS